MGSNVVEEGYRVEVFFSEKLLVLYLVFFLFKDFEDLRVILCIKYIQFFKNLGLYYIW